MQNILILTVNLIFIYFKIVSSQIQNSNRLRNLIINIFYVTFWGKNF
jgi:hypothetical protein